MGIILDSLINSNNKKIDRYRAEIEKLELGIQDAEAAIGKFQEAGSSLSVLNDEVKICFKGEAAAAFIAKLESLLFAGVSIIPPLSVRITTYKRRIEEIQAQIRKLQQWNNFYNEISNILKWNFR